MDSANGTAPQSDNYFRDLAILDWLGELGATETIGETGINRYDLPETAPTLKTSAPAVTRPAIKENTKSIPNSEAIAAACTDIEMLQKTLFEFEDCPLKKGARSTVFADGNPGAQVMVIGDTPDRDEDRSGRPFSGQTGNLLDRMLAAIDLSRHAETGDAAFYATCLSPWRTPQGRDLSDVEIKLLRPFVLRHIALANPRFLILMGSQPTKNLLGFDKAISHTRGQWGQVAGIPALAMFSPANLLRNPLHKRAAWADLLALKARLKG